MMEKLDNLKFLGRLLEMNVDYYQRNTRKKIQGLLPELYSKRIYSILDVCVDHSFNLVRDADNYYLIISFGNSEYLVMQPEMSAPLYSSKNLALFTLTPQVKPVLQFAYQLFKKSAAPDWPLYSFYLDDKATTGKSPKNVVEFSAEEEREMQSNFAGLLDAFNKLDEERLVYYLKSKLRSKRYGEIFKNKNYLRGQKDSLIAYLSVLNESAIRNNYPVNEAYYIFNQIIAKIEMQETQISYDVWLENITMYYFNELKRYFRERNMPIAERVQNYIMEHITYRLSLQDLSDAFGYSERYLNRKFKEYYKTTIKQYVLSKKIEVAKKMLVTTDFSLKCIAARLSFTTTSHFIQVFKSIVGMTPKQYSKQQCYESLDSENLVSELSD